MSDGAGSSIWMQTVPSNITTNGQEWVGFSVDMFWMDPFDFELRELVRTRGSWLCFGVHLV